MHQTTKKALVLIMVIAIISYFVAMIVFALSKGSQNINTNKEEAASQLDMCLQKADDTHNERVASFKKSLKEKSTVSTDEYAAHVKTAELYNERHKNDRNDCYRYEEVTR